MHAHTKSRSQIKDHGHWSGNETSRQAKLPVGSGVLMAGTPAELGKAGMNTTLVRRYIQLPTFSYTKTSLLTTLVNCKARMVSFQYDRCL